MKLEEDKVFDEFLDSEEVDCIFGELQSAVKKAFLAGCKVSESRNEN